MALVTGAAAASAGPFADLYVDKGADVVLVDLLPPAHDAARDLAARGQKTLGIVADLTVTETVQQVVAQALDEFGRIDILVNNAGAALLEPAQTLPEDYSDRTMAINLRPVHPVAAGGRAMIAAGGGKI